MTRRWGMVHPNPNMMKPSSQSNASGSPAIAWEYLTKKTSTMSVDLLVPPDPSEQCAFADNGAFNHLGRRYTPED